MRRWGWRAAAAAAAIAIAACVDLGGPQAGVVSISSLRRPSPSVVVGDVMRDSLGAPAPLTLIAFDAKGEPIAGEPVTFVALDTTIKVDADGTVHGLFRDSIGGRVVGGAGGLQSGQQRIVVSVKPELVTKSDAATEILFDIAATDSSKQSNWSPPLTVTVTGAGAVGAQGFIVNYEMVRPPKPLGATPGAYIGEDATRKWSRDTTDQRGTASRRVILRLADVADEPLLSGARADTIIVRASVKYLGADLAGSPVDFVIPVKKKP